MIYPVGYDGMLMPVEANSKEEARSKFEKYCEEKSKECGTVFKFGHITVYDQSNGYNEWVKEMDIKILR